MDAIPWIGGFARSLAGAAAILPWIRWKATAQATLSRAEAAERTLTFLHDELSERETALAELTRRLEWTTGELLRIRNLLREREAEFVRATGKVVEYEEALQGAGRALTAVQDDVAADQAALAKQLEEARKAAAYLRRARIALEERDAELKRVQARLARKRNAVEARGRRRRDPGDRGGAPRGPRPDGPKEPTQKRSSPELRAFLEDGTWQLYIEDESSLNGGTSPLQRIIEGLKPVEDGIYGPISRSSVIQDLEPNGALIFRMTGDCSARRCRNPSTGLHFVIVPSDWKYVEAKSGPAPADPDQCGIPGYELHYFSLDRGLPKVFARPDELDFKIEKTEYRLDGRVLPDAEGKMGPLLVGNPPYLVADGSGLDRVKSVVIGDEGPGKGRWRNSYPCDPQHDGRWPLPDELQRQRVGWYFLRLHDEADNLIESLTFRYVNGLQDIRMRLPELGSDSTADASVIFMHDREIQVRPAAEIASCKSTHTKMSDYFETGFQWIPDPRIRVARFKVSDGTRTVDIGIEADRVWWKIIDGGESDQEAPWRDSLSRLDVGAFRATSNTELHVWFPQSMKQGGRVGFRHNHCRRLPAPNADGVTHISLYEFSESSELKLIGENGFYLWPPDGGVGEPLTLLSVSIMGYCSWCEKN